MACGATLSMKRNLDFDPLHCPGQGTPKRRRCMPMTLSPSTPPTKSHQTNPSPFKEVGQKLTSEQIAANISYEIRRMQRRKQLHYSSGQSPPHPSSQAECASPSSSQSLMDSAVSTSNSSTNLFTALSPNRKDAPLFTFRQVGMICERMLKDRENMIREEYNTVLTCKLAEQYEAFLRFNHDQIHKKFGDTPVSYVS
ncbi:hypothetical protein ScPMuIL_011753 [Solemya velum]